MENELSLDEESSTGSAGAQPGGLLAVHAHPDDETLATGALLATWAASGAQVTLVTCTRGEQGEVIGPDPDGLEGNGPALAAHRETELAGAVVALGIDQQVFLDELGGCEHRIEDSGMAWLPGQRSGTAEAPSEIPPGAFVAVAIEDAARPVADLILRERPDVVVTYDPAGGYGHPDHVRAHEVTMRAVELVRASLPTGDAGPGVLWASMRPGDLRSVWRELARAPWVRAVATERGLDAPDPEGALPAVASQERTVAVEVDVEPVLDWILAGLESHVTQVHAVAAGPKRARASVGSDETEQLGVSSSGPSGHVLACYALSNDVLGAVPRIETYAWAPGAPGASGATPTAGRTVAWPTGVRTVA